MSDTEYTHFTDALDAHFDQGCGVEPSVRKLVKAELVAYHDRNGFIPKVWICVRKFRDFDEYPVFFQIDKSVNANSGMEFICGIFQIADGSIDYTTGTMEYKSKIAARKTWDNLANSAGDYFKVLWSTETYPAIKKYTVPREDPMPMIVGTGT